MAEAAKTIKQIRESLPGQLSHIFGDAIPADKIRLPEGSRTRIFDTRTTFWAFLGQVFRGGSQREAVREVQATRKRLKLPPISDNTAAFSEARSRLPLEVIEEVHEMLCQQIEKESRRSGRRLIGVDGTSCQLADTAANQLDYPQPSGQKPGCGWPVMQAVCLHDIDTGALLQVAESAQTDHEASWFQVDLIHSIRKRDIVLADRGFCSYLTIALILARGADVVFRLHASRIFKGKENDVIVTWKRPPLSRMPSHILEEEWEQLPETIQVRYVRYKIKQPGFRTREVILVTTLLDAPAEELTETYRRRWDTELCFRDLKTTLGMEWIHCKTPLMAHKQMLVYLIAHNLIRWLLQRASQQSGQPLKHLSFKGALDTVHRWIPELHAMPANRRKEAIAQMLWSIASDLIPHRPNRYEPRRQKRRPKFTLLTRPRAHYSPETNTLTQPKQALS